MYQDMSPIHRIRSRAMAQFSTSTFCLCSEDHFVYKYTYGTARCFRLFRLPVPSHSPLAYVKDWGLRNMFVRFFRRNIGISHVIELPTGTVLAFYDKVYRYTDSGGSGVAEPIVSFRALNVFPPLRNGIGVNPENNYAYFGEYQNSRPYAVKIVRLSDDGQKAEICYTFPEGRIKHIHSITWDPYRKRLWIATGDTNEEVGLYYTDNDFATVTYFNGGKQAWRMIGLLPTEERLYWGSDAGKDAMQEDVNYIYSWNFSKNSLEKICEIGNPAYYSVFLDNGGMLIGTTYEPGMKQLTEHSAALWYSLEGKQWEKICSLAYKDLGKSQRTRYATLNLPRGLVPSSHVPFTPLNTEKWDFDLVTVAL